MSGTDNRRPLILFSGGLDSTHMLHCALKHSNVDTLYIEASQTKQKIEAELIAREKIFAALKELHTLSLKNGSEKLHEVVNDIRMPPVGIQTAYGPHSNFPILVGHVGTTSMASLNGFTQLQQWFINALWAVDPAAHSCVQVGFLMDDDSTHLIGELQAAWRHCMRAFKGPLEKTYWSEPPHLSFPLHFISKRYVLANVDSTLAQLSWSCEMPWQRNDGSWNACGMCVPCVDKKRALEDNRNTEQFNSYTLRCFAGHHGMHEGKPTPPKPRIKLRVKTS